MGSAMLGAVGSLGQPELSSPTAREVNPSGHSAKSQCPFREPRAGPVPWKARRVDDLPFNLEVRSCACTNRRTFFSSAVAESQSAAWSCRQTCRLRLGEWSAVCSAEAARPRSEDRSTDGADVRCVATDGVPYSGWRSARLSGARQRLRRTACITPCCANHLRDAALRVKEE